MAVQFNEKRFLTRQEKKNKIQAQPLLTSSAPYQPSIQRRENSQQQTKQEKQPQEPESSKADPEKAQEQPQDAASKSVAVASPPANTAGAAANSSGNPPANQNNQTQEKQPAEPKAKNLNPEQPQAPTQGAAQSVNSTEIASEKAPASANNDPGFQAVVGTTKEVAEKQQQHEPAKNKAQEAQAAAQPPGNEVNSKAQANQVGEMGQAKTPEFDAAAFKAKLMERIADMAPKNLKEADEFKNHNKLDSVKGDLSGKVKQEQKTSQGQLEQKAKETPDTSGIEPKQVTPLPETNPGTAPSDIDAKKAAPKSKGHSEVEAPLQQESKKLDQQLSQADITEEQLANSNEPEFQAALKAKKSAQTNATQAPQQYRQQEQNLLTNAQATAEATAQQQLQAMHGTRTQNLGQVANQQVGAKGKDEQARAKVAGDINKIYEDTKVKVEKTLSDLDGQGEQEFDAGAAEAKKAFEDYVAKRMDDYKSDRYSGIIGKGKWLKDQFVGLPDEVNAFYQEGRRFYIEKMDGVINKVVSIISKGLTQAKAEIAKGKQEIQNYVNKLPQDLKAVGQQAATDIEGKFEALEQSVNDQQDELIDTLAQKYQENLEAVDARIDEMKAANGGLIQKAFDAVAGVIKTIVELAKMLTEVLARVASVVGQILKDPIGFLGNLIQALKQGFLNFMNNIGKHLQKGLIGWLTGTMAESGIEMPEKFDLKGIFTLVTQVLGFTYQVIRAQAVKRLGEQKVGYLEQKFQIFQILASEGIGGIWQFVQERMGDLNELVIQPIKNFVIEKVVIAGIEWVISLLTPASAFVKAAKAIYQIISFFIERAQQIADLMNAILDAVSAIASGASDQAVKGVENALAKSLPVVISFLASLLGLGGIAGKVQAIFQKLRTPVEKAVDWIIDKGAKVANKVTHKFNKSKFGKKFHAVKDSAKEKYKAGKRWVEDKKQATKQWVEDKKHNNSKYSKPDERSPKQKQDDLNQGLAEAHELIKDDNTSSEAVKKHLVGIKSKYQMTSLELVVKSQHGAKETVYVKGKVNPTGKTGDEEILGEPENLNDKSVEVLVREADSDWKKVKAKYLADPSIMRKIIAFREQEVKGIIDQVKARLNDDQFKAIAVGSKDLTSDYDITFDASGNQSVEIKAVKLFNQIFRQRWGKESGTVFDTNVYTTGHMPVGEGKKQKEQDKRETEWQMTQKGEKSSQEIQDVMSLLKMRRFMSDIEWKAYKRNIVNNISRQDHRLKMIGRFTEVDTLYKQTNVQMERKIDELNQEVKNLNLSIKERVKQIKQNNPDAEMEASNRLYEEYLEKVDRIFQELQQLKQEVKAAGVRTKQQSQKLDKLTLELQRSRSMALVFANEAYHTGGAVEHVVLNQQMGLDISITNQQYLQSINEQTGFAVEQINHSKNVGTALWKSAKYVDRLCDAIARIDIQNFKRPQEQEKLSQLAKTLLQIKKAQGDYQNLKTDEEKSQAAKKVGRRNGYTSRETWLQAVLNLNQEVNQEIRSKLSQKTNKTNQNRN